MKFQNETVAGTQAADICPTPPAPPRRPTWLRKPRREALISRGLNQESEASARAATVVASVEKRRGRFFRSADGALSIVLGGDRIPLILTNENLRLSRLLLDETGIGTSSTLGRMIVERLRVYAEGEAGGLRSCSFAWYSCERRLYVPVADGRHLLRVTPDGMGLVPNGADHCWVEHPNNDSMVFRSGAAEAEIANGLAEFERLLVETQACDRPAAWLLAICEGLVPYFRDQLDARPLIVHLGASQSGKTTGARRFLTVHGLGEVKGDFSSAAVGDSGDPGLLVLDNREQQHLTPALTDYLLFASTGGSRGRSNPLGAVRSGSASRPIVVLTTIEGVHKQELRNRCIEIRFRRLPDAPTIVRERNTQDIVAARSRILTALMHVIQCYLADQPAAPVDMGDCPMPNFGSFFRLVCGLLRAFAACADRPSSWANALIADWTQLLRDTGDEDRHDSMLAHYVHKIVSSPAVQAQQVRANIGGTDGTIFVTRAAKLLEQLRLVRGAEGELPATPNGLVNRLRSLAAPQVQVLDSSMAARFPALRRSSSHRSLGLFLPDPEGWAGEYENLAEPRLQRLDASDVDGRPHLPIGAKCYSLWGYSPEGEEAASNCAQAVNAGRLIRALKSSWLSAREEKLRAIRFAAGALGSSFGPEWFDHIFVPIPPSKRFGSEGYDPRISDMLSHVRPRLNVLDLLAVRESSEALRKDVTFADRLENLIVQGAVPGSATVVLVDDVVTTGIHFQVASAKILMRFPGVTIVGLFLARALRSVPVSS